MKDKFQEVLDTVNSTWGALALRSAEDALVCVKAAILTNVKNDHIKGAIMNLVLLGLERGPNEVDQESCFVEKETVCGILQLHIDAGTTLYGVQCVYAHPDDDGYCEHAAAPPSKRISPDFEEIKSDAQELMETLVDNAPPFITDCEVKLSMFDDSGMVSMGMWTWSRRHHHAVWVTPEDRH